LERRPQRPGPIRPEDFQNTYRDTVQSLRQLEQQAQADPNMLKDIQTLMRDLQRLDPYTYANDPLLAQRIHAALMSGVEQVEMELRRKVDEAAGNGKRPQPRRRDRPARLRRRRCGILPQAEQVEVALGAEIGLLEGEWPGRYTGTKHILSMKTYTFKVVVEPDEDALGNPAWHAYCPALESIGAATSGRTRDEALKNISQVVHTIVEESLEEGRPLPEGPADDVSAMPMSTGAA